MINRSLLACTVLLVSIPSFNQAPTDSNSNTSAEVKTVEQPQATNNDSKVDNKEIKDLKNQSDEKETPIKIVKYLDFTKPKAERDALNDSKSNAINNSLAVRKSITYTVRGKTYRTISDAENFRQEGYASWYGPGFHGRKTASGEVFNQYAMTAAHKRLPLGTKIKVTNLDNGKSVVVTVNDRGPFHGGRILDLSKAAAEKIGAIHAGVANVSIVAIK